MEQVINADDFRPKLIDGKQVASSEYRSWQMMKNRCLNPKCQDFSYYGGRGITVCPEWMEFDNFIRDVGAKPAPELTLERRDADLGYTSENCYWATRKEQAQNRRFIKRYNGKTVWEWAETLGIKPMSFHMRLWRHGKGEISEAQLFRSCK